MPAISLSVDRYQPLLRTQEVVFDPQVHAVDGITPVLEHNSENRQGDPDCEQPAPHHIAPG